MEPKVSIIIPAYNHKKYIGEAIQSVLNQTFEAFELIIVDDGSTDGSAEEIKKYKDKRIFYIWQGNSGPSSAINRGLQVARGRFWGFLPSDDVFEHDKLAHQVKILESDGSIGMVATHISVIDEKSNPIVHPLLNDRFNVPFETKEEIFPRLFRRNILSAPTVLARKECLEKVGFFDPMLFYVQDYDLWLKILKYYDIRLIRKKSLKYRWHGSNLTKKGKNSHIISMERSVAVTRAFLNLSIEDIFPSLKGRKGDGKAYAKAYKKLFEYIMEENMPELRAIAFFCLEKARIFVPEEVTECDIALLRSKPWIYSKLEERRVPFKSTLFSKVQSEIKRIVKRKTETGGKG